MEKITRPLYIGIAGNMGVGKTSLVQLLSKEFNWKSNYESVDNNPYLSDFYGDMKKYSFPLQIYFLHDRFNQVLEIKNSKQTVIQDRTIYEDAFIFAKSLHKMNLMSNRDYENYLKLFQTMAEIITPPDLIIYLKSDIPKIVHQIKKRGREYENEIDVEYLKGLNDNYNEWMDGYKHKQLVINTNDLDFVNNPEDFELIVGEIVDNLK
jgi:deoxyadenosine/deoxycytidine kinase